MRVQFGEFTLDAGSRLLLRNGQEVHLVPKAFDLLQLLLERRPEAVSKPQIRDCLWPDTFVSESTLTSLVTGLRRALDDDAKRPRFVRTVYGRGYAFAGAAAAATERRPRRSPRFRLFSEDREIVLREGENILGREEDAAVESTRRRRRAAMRASSWPASGRRWRTWAAAMARIMGVSGSRSRSRSGTATRSGSDERC